MTIDKDGAAAFFAKRNPDEVRLNRGAGNATQRTSDVRSFGHFAFRLLHTTNGAFGRQVPVP